MSRRILMAEAGLTAALLVAAMAKRARVRHQGAYVVVDTHPDALTPTAPTTPSVGRNERCPCGSGAKFKKCCLR